ncbi:hypothetical protein J7J90_00470 [Candidatus Micrarchaeota archaeon]|nr:hypothetical protein [Candidatus Micrarchaeota archaeon]
MNKFILLCFILFIASIYSIAETNILPPELPDPNKGNVDVYLVTSYDEPLSRTAVTVNLENKMLFRNTDNNGTLHFQVDKGYHSAIFIADEFATPVEDYISSNVSFFVNDSVHFKTVLFPVGRINGLCAPESLVSIDCFSSHPLKEQTITCDEFGKFTVLAPVGICNVKTINGTFDVSVQHGEITHISEHNDYFMLFVISGGIMLLVIAITYLVFKKKNVVRKYEQFDESVLKTLNKNEEMIVRHLISKGGWARQAEIIRELGMSRATFFRAVSNLQSKNIVRKIKKGINVTVELTPMYFHSERKKD